MHSAALTVPRYFANLPFGVGLGLEVPVGHSNPGGHGPEPLAVVDAASQKNPTSKFKAEKIVEI